MTYSPEDADNKVIILPLRNGSDIDWNFLRSIDTLKDAKLEPITDEARADFKVKYMLSLRSLIFKVSVFY